MNKKFLVTGGTGFLGAALVKRLVSNGHFVRVLDNGFRSSASSLSEIQDHIECIQADIRDPQAVADSINGMDAVLHLAAINGTEFFYSKPYLVLDVGVRGMLNVIDGCLKHGVGDLIVASSSEVYQTPKTIPTDETEPLSVPDVLNPRYSYGGAKIISELLTLNCARSNFDRVQIFRPHNVYGPQMGWEHVIPQFALRALEAIENHPTGPVPFPIQGDGLQTRAFIYIEDMIDGIMLMIEKGEHFNIYHIGNPEEVTIASLAESIMNYFGRALFLEPATLQQGSTERRCPNIDKIMALGFTPKTPLKEGLPIALDWYAKHAKFHSTAEV